MNNIITFGVADDEQFVHNMFTDIVAKMEKQIDIKCKIEHFYNTDELEDFCYDNPDTLELLFLDIQFGDGNPTGLDSLPTVREYCPDLFITMLTGFAPDLATGIDYSEKYNIEFLEKPVSYIEVSTKIINAKKYFEGYSRVLKELKENNELMEIYSQENTEIQNAMAQKGLEVKNFIDEMNERLEGSIKKDIKILAEEIFDNLEFKPAALIEIFGKHFDKGVYKVLKAVNDGNTLQNGFKKQLFVEWGIENLYEYRLSRKGRVFIQEIGGEKPLVYAVDYNHDKH